MSEKREYSHETIVALAAWSRGTCYYPDCPAPLVVKRSGKPVIAAQIAHIAALKEGGQRYDRILTVAQRNGWPNLIFLCQADHTEVDRKNPDKYSIETLQAWKVKHERDGMAGLRGLSDLTEDRLEQIVEQSAERLRSDVNAALAEIKGLNSRTAQLIESLIAQVTEFGTAPVGVNEDVAGALTSAARDLAHLQDTVTMLVTAASNLNGLESTLTSLSSAAEYLSGMQDLASGISSAARELRNARGEY